MSAKDRVISLLRNMISAGHSCPAHCHSLPVSSTAERSAKIHDIARNGDTDYAFEMASSSVRYGAGVTAELGMDLTGWRAKLVCVLTDPTLVNMRPVQEALKSLDQHRVEYRLFDRVSVEPTASSFKEAAQFASEHVFDAFVAIGGGSVIDTAKAANLYSCRPHADFLDFVNAPIGRGLPVGDFPPLKPLLAVPTTAGTGSETTGVAIFDMPSLGAKTGIANRQLRPTLALVDPLHTLTMPTAVACYSGLDVLCHALESYTALPYDQRSPRPATPHLRPAYQGSNPVSDIWAEATLRIISRHFVRAVRRSDDLEARSAMHLASTMAGVGFGNAGVHLCHGMSYPISSLAKNHTPAEGYPQQQSLVPHGLSVAVTAPAVFRFTSSLAVDKHLKAARLLGADPAGKCRPEDAGELLADTLLKIFDDLNVANGLGALGLTERDIPALVQGTLPQKRVTSLAPRSQTEGDLAELFRNSMSIY